MSGLNQYKTYQLETMAPEDRVAVLYERAQRFIDRAALALEQGDLPEVSVNVGKAQQIFAELTASLNFEAGEIARNLQQLYEYWSWRLSQGLIKKDVAAFREVSATLGDMAQAWADAARQVRAQRGATLRG